MIRVLARTSKAWGISRTTLQGRQYPFFLNQSRLFSRKNTDVPDEFFNPEIEEEKKFLDVSTSITFGGLEHLPLLKEAWTWSEIDASLDQSPDFSLDEGDLDGEEMNSLNISPPLTEDEEFPLLANALIPQDIADHVDEFPEDSIVPTEYLDYNIPWRKTDKFPEPLLEPFIADTSPEKYNHDMQGLRSCEGKKQRHGRTDTLRCHIIDLEVLNHFDVLELRRFISEDGEILGRKWTGLCAKCQRKVAKNIKRSRHFGLLPHIGEFMIQDGSPYSPNGEFHEITPTSAAKVKSDSIV